MPPLQPNILWNVVINTAEKTYSICPANKPLVAGQAIHKQEPLDACIDYVDEHPLMEEDYYQSLQNPNKKSFFKLFTILLMVFSNKLIYRYLKKQNRPVFIDLKTDYPELLAVEQNFDDINKELNGVLVQRTEIPRFHDADPAQIEISHSETDKSWRVFYLNCYGQKPKENCLLCPMTTQLLDSISGIQEAFFSILESGKSIPPHNGPYLGIVRYHLALKIPQVSPPEIRVYDQFYTWKERESIVFDDTWNHEVINHSSERRVILFLDVKRKLPFLLNLINTACLRLLGTKYGKIVKENLNWNR